MTRWAAVQVVAQLSVTGLVLAATAITGNYEGSDDPALTLTVAEAPDGSVTGRLTDGDVVMNLQGSRQGDVVAGSLVHGAERLPVTARVQADQLVLEVGPADDREIVRLVRSSREVVARSPARSPPVAGGQVVVNGTTLSAADLALAQDTYGIRIPPGDFWYDTVLGAWGGRGGPTMGFIAPGLALGGPLQADASGPGTNVFVNGRALHPYDLLALQQLTGPILPGRYFITATGLAGFENGPPLWNLAALAASSRAQGGGSNTWQSRVTGASGFSDGTTGAVFLPNGGIVSTGN